VTASAGSTLECVLYSVSSRHDLEMIPQNMPQSGADGS